VNRRNTECSQLYQAWDTKPIPRNKSNMQYQFNNKMFGSIIVGLFEVFNNNSVDVKEIYKNQRKFYWKNSY
jgi:hypothetical protein